MDSGNTFTDQNRKHWDQTAETYATEQWHKDVIKQTRDFVLSNLDWIGVDLLGPSGAGDGERDTGRVRVLDYACGPGTITTILQGCADEFVGVDLSENMVKVYNQRFAGEQGERDSGVSAEAVVGDLLLDSGGGPHDQDSPLSDPKYFDFDLAVVGYGFHHFENLDFATARLASRLKPGGVLLIVDFVSHPKEEGGPASHTVAHHGFGEEEVRAIFGKAGLVDVAVKELAGAVGFRKPGSSEHDPLEQRKLFLGKGKKAT